MSHLKPPPPPPTQRPKQACAAETANLLSKGQGKGLAEGMRSGAGEGGRRPIFIPSAPTGQESRGLPCWGPGLCHGIHSNHAQTARFNSPTVLPPLQTMSLLFGPARGAAPYGLLLSICTVAANAPRLLSVLAVALRLCLAITMHCTNGGQWCRCNLLITTDSHELNCRRHRYLLKATECFSVETRPLLKLPLCVCVCVCVCVIVPFLPGLPVEPV